MWTGPCSGRVVVRVWLSEEDDCGDGDKAGNQSEVSIIRSDQSEAAYLAPPTTAPESICSSSLEIVATERAELWKGK